MRVLWIGTKPPWPPIDGGRLATALTVEALAAAGAEVSVLVPEVEPRCPPPAGVELATVAGGPTPWLWAAARGLATGGSSTLERHRLAALGREVAREIERRRPTVVHAEQLQSLLQAEPARRAGVPVVLRAQNVESDLWRGAADLTGGWRARWLAAEARRLARAEGAAVRRVARTVALTEADAARLAALAGPGFAVEPLAVPFPRDLPAGPALEGEPAVVLVGSGGWLPNRAGAEWFLDRVWPRVLALRPAARLHLFGEEPAGGPRAGLIPWPAPADSATAFPRGGVLAVPLHVASGVRMKILEAWARGLPVVATPEAAAGLGAEHGREILIASDPEALARALAELGEDQARALVRAGRMLLAARHDPARIAGRLLAIYRDAAEGAAKSRVMNSS